ncbi:MAG: hypothetical protein IPI63_03215 [Methanothrix sp.]|uniref:hypothetical protein n=1 Tax=Methanothrix sp. TaxID=90426 RepID=UPI0025D131C0|nr:hypothetical protein [Methanothrix sp.]MBK7385773.1 hypothetical protein [Methanothrix sp.]
MMLISFWLGYLKIPDIFSIRPFILFRPSLSSHPPNQFRKLTKKDANLRERLKRSRSK